MKLPDLSLLPCRRLVCFKGSFRKDIPQKGRRKLTLIHESHQSNFNTVASQLMMSFLLVAVVGTNLSMMIKYAIKLSAILTVIF